MSSRFGNLKTKPVPTPTQAPAPTNENAAPTERRPSAVAKARDGKKPVMGYYSPAVRRQLHQLALDEGSSIQALLGEALDHLMRARGKHPFGER